VHQVIQSLHQQVQTLPTQAINLTGIEAEIADLKAKLQALECADMVQPSHNNESQLAPINDSKEIPQQEIRSDNIGRGSLTKILVIGVCREGCEAVNRIIEAEITGVNLGFPYVRGVMADAGLALLGIGVGSGKSRATEAAMAAISSPLSDCSIEGAKGVIIYFTASNLTIGEVNDAVNTISEVVDPSANIIFDIVVDESTS
jgi:cell division GTPase FtsZ